MSKGDEVGGGRVPRLGPNIAYPRDNSATLASDHYFWACTRTPEMVTECGVLELFATKFTATATQDQITGKSLRPYYTFQMAGGRRTNCRRDSSQDGWADFSLTRACRNTGQGPAASCEIWSGSWKVVGAIDRWRCSGQPFRDVLLADDQRDTMTQPFNPLGYTEAAFRQGVSANLENAWSGTQTIVLVTDGTAVVAPRATVVPAGERATLVLSSEVTISGPVR